jgi:4'-phosphopantetheinyl transferase
LSASLALEPREIHVWLTSYADADRHLQVRYREMLDSGERMQQRRFHFADDRLRYLVTRALVRTSLSRYLPIEPGDWMFERDGYGKPHIANTDARAEDLSFNVSHTRELIVLAITRGRAIGVDAEHVLLRQAPLDIAAKYFSGREKEALDAHPVHERGLRFFEYWTFKESYIKARGLGLSLPLNKFSFHYPRAGAVEFMVDPALSDSSSRWQFWQFSPTTAHVVAVCAERLGVMPPELIFRHTIPLCAEAVMNPRLARVSQHS